MSGDARNVPVNPKEENPKAASAHVTDRKACCARIGRRDNTQKSNPKRKGIAVVCLLTGRDRFGGNPLAKMARCEKGKRHVGIGIGGESILSADQE